MTKAQSHPNSLIGEYLKKARIKHGYSLRNVAQITGISHNHIRLIEDSKITPGFDMIVRLLKAYSLTIEDFSQKTGYNYICEVKEMPAPFRERLSSDIQKLSDIEKNLFLRELKYSSEFLSKVLQGEAALSEQEVTELAILLKQPLFEYLDIAGYLPEELKALKYHGTVDLLRSINELNANELVIVVKAITDMLKIANKKGGE